MGGRTTNLLQRHLRNLRKQHGWTQEELAQRAGVDVRTVQRIEAGHLPEADTLRAIANAFDIDVAELLSLQHQTPQAPRAKILPLIADGVAFAQSIGGARGHFFNHANTRTPEETALIAELAQLTKDLIDIWEDLEPKDRVEMTADISKQINTLWSAGWAVFGKQERTEFKNDLSGEQFTLPVAFISVTPLNSPSVQIDPAWREHFERAANNTKRSKRDQ